MPTRVTIEDVARRAQVSKVTVSYVLNGRGKSERISAGTMERVQVAARDLGYRPSAIARMLLSKRSRTLAVVFQYGAYFSAWSSFTNEAMRGVCDEAVARGYDLMLHTKAQGSSEDEADALGDGRVDGALFLRDADDPTLEALIDREFKAVQFFTRSDHGTASWVDTDNRLGGELAAAHLLSLGHSRLAMVVGSPGSVSSRLRLDGFESLVGPRDHVVMASAEEGSDALVDLMRRKDRPTALFVWSDDVAFRVIELLSSLGLSVPKDVSIIGFDSLPACERSTPPLTSVAQPVRAIAREATGLLVDLIEGRQTEPKRVLHPPVLDVRGSTAPPAQC